MEPCEKRQRLVDSVTKEERFRCIHRDHELFGHTVNEVVCDVCPLRVMLHGGPPCQKKHVRLEDIKKPCEGCKPVDDETLIKAFASARYLEEVKISPEDTPDGKIPDYPAMSMQLWLYKEALLRWQRAGRPVRSDEEVDRILNNNCKKCDWYDPEKKRCKGCGCRVTDGGLAAINKIRMATEHCPHPERKW